MSLAKKGAWILHLTPRHLSSCVHSVCWRLVLPAGLPQCEPMAIGLQNSLPGPAHGLTTLPVPSCLWILLMLPALRKTPSSPSIPPLISRVTQDIPFYLSLCENVNISSQPKSKGYSFSFVQNHSYLEKNRSYKQLGLIDHIPSPHFCKRWSSFWCQNSRKKEKCNKLSSFPYTTANK